MTRVMAQAVHLGALFLLTLALFRIPAPAAPAAELFLDVQILNQSAQPMPAVQVELKSAAVSFPAQQTNAEGRAKFLNAVSMSVAEAQFRAGVVNDFESACLGFSGGPDDKDALTREVVKAAHYSITHDALIALEGATAGEPGVVVIAGTGSIAWGRGPTGRTARAGGWGPVIGDEGGGAWIGRHALGIVAAATDHREPDTALIGAIRTACDVEEVAGLVAWAARATSADLARLVGTVVETADAGDLRANALITLAVEELVLHVRAVARELFGDERAACPVALAGGMMKSGSTMRKRTEHRLKSAVPGAVLHQGEVLAARGAVRGALRLLGVGVGSE